MCCCSMMCRLWLFKKVHVVPSSIQSYFWELRLDQKQHRIERRGKERKNAMNRTPFKHQAAVFLFYGFCN